MRSTTKSSTHHFHDILCDRVVYEKPFGRDLSSAKSLFSSLSSSLIDQNSILMGVDEMVDDKMVDYEMVDG